MKKENGMGHIMLVFCVIAIIAIIIFSVKILLNESKQRTIENFITDMLLLQGKVKVIAQENEMNEEEHPLVGIQVKGNMENENVKQVLKANNISEETENFESYYIIDSENLNDLKLNNNLNQEFYIVNYKNYEIIYSKGIEIEGEMHYSLNKLLEHRK